MLHQLTRATILPLLRRIGSTAFILLCCGLAIFALGTSKTRMALALLVVALPLLIYLSVFRPLVFPFSFYVLLVPFENLLSTDKYGTITKLMALVVAAALAFYIVRTKKAVGVSTRQLLVWGLLILFMALSVFWAINPSQSVRYLLTYAELFALYAIVSIAPVSASDLKVILRAVVAGACIASTYAVHLFAGGGAEAASRQVVSGESRLDPNAFATALLLPIAIVLMSALSKRWSLKKLGYIVLFLILLGGMYKADSRGAFIGLAVTLGFLLLRSRHRAQLIAMSIAGLLVSFLMPHSPWARFKGAVSHGGSGRIKIWLVGWDAFKHHWLLGSGTGMFQFAYDQSLIRVYQSVYSYWHKVAHNTPVSVAVELGAAGFILFCVAWYTQWKIFSDLGSSSTLYDLRLALQAAMIGVSVSSLFLSILATKLLWLLFTVMTLTRTVALHEEAVQVVTSPLPPVSLNLPEATIAAAESYR